MIRSEARNQAVFMIFTMLILPTSDSFENPPEGRSRKFFNVAEFPVGKTRFQLLFFFHFFFFAGQSDHTRHQKSDKKPWSSPTDKGIPISLNIFQLETQISRRVPSRDVQQKLTITGLLSRAGSDVQSCCFRTAVRVAEIHHIQSLRGAIVTKITQLRFQSAPRPCASNRLPAEFTDKTARSWN